MVPMGYCGDLVGQATPRASTRADTQQASNRRINVTSNYIPTMIKKKNSPVVRRYNVVKSPQVRKKS